MKQLKTFSEIKNKVHDASGIDNPELYYWVKDKNIYYPYDKITKS